MTKRASINFHYFLIIVISMLVVACLDEITLDDPDNTLDSIAIGGRLIHGSPSIVSVSVSSLSDFVAQDSPEPISGAEVFLENQTGQRIRLSINTNGVYEAIIDSDDPNITITIGHTYNIVVNIPTVGTFESSPEPLLPVPKIEAVHKTAKKQIVLDQIENIDTVSVMTFAVDTKLQTPENIERPSLKWELSGTYKFREASLAAEPRLIIDLCYYTDLLGINKVPLFDGQSASQSDLINKTILEEELDHRFNSGFYLLIKQQSLSQGAFRYWDQINQVIDRDGSFFETVPAKVNGNITNITNPDIPVFGYFHAIAEDTMRIFISPKDAAFPSTLCKGVQTRNEYLGLQEECRNCLNKPGSTLDKPTFWID